MIRTTSTPYKVRQHWLAIILVVWSLNSYGQVRFDPDMLKHPSQSGEAVSKLLVTSEVTEYQKPGAGKHCLLLEMDFRSSWIKNPEAWTAIKDTVEAWKIEVVYSRYPLRNGCYPEIYPLLLRRLQRLFQLDSSLNTVDINWFKVLQTHCLDDAQVATLFHGVVVWYHTKTELEKGLYPHRGKAKSATALSDKAKDSPNNAGKLEEILETYRLPESMKKRLEDLPPKKKEEVMKTYLETRIQSSPDFSLSKASDTEVKALKGEIDEFLSIYGNNDIVVSKVLDRHAEWRNMVVVNDWTGSMYQYGAQVLKWHVLNLERSGITSLFLFNDGDGKKDNAKVIGSTGGIYREKADNIYKLIDLFYLTMLKGGGGDSQENDIEAILRAIKAYPDCTNILLIADHNACVRDIELADRIQVPVKISLCGYDTTKPINPDFVYLAKKTDGGIYTIEQDIEELQVTLGEKGAVLNSSDKRFVLKTTRCRGGDIPRNEDEVFGKNRKMRSNRDSIYRIDLSGIHLDKLPKEVYRAHHTRYLNLSSNDLSDVPARLGSLNLLKEVDLSENKLSDLPEKLFSLAYLNKLDVSCNKIENLPEVISRLRFLITLNAASNNIRRFPVDFNLPLLEILDLSDNQISAVPEDIVNLRKLRVLRLSRNKLTVLPDAITGLVRLSALDLEDNNLVKLPDRISNLKKLKLLRLKGNPIPEEERRRIRAALPGTVVMFE